MLKNFALLFLIFLVGCGPASIDEVKGEIENLGHNIHKKSWINASENVSKLEDWWEYQKSEYRKEDAKKFEKLIHDIDLNISSINKKKSRQHWEELKDQWNDINTREYQIE